MADNQHYLLDTFKPGDGLDEFNAFSESVQYALNDLSSRIDGTNTKSAQIRYNVPISEDVTPGTLVYWRLPSDTASQAVFAPALAVLRAIPGSQGESIEADSARVAGMIISTDSTNTMGTLLMGGYWESQACADACLGSSAASGTYYLSPINAGMATMTPGSNLRQPVLTYYGNGKFSLSLFYLAHDNHFHTSSVLSPENWVSAETLAEEKGVTAPSTATYGYLADDSDFSRLGEISSNTTAIFEDGVLVSPNSTSGYIIENGILWACTLASPASKTVTLFNHFPFAYGSPVVRTIESVSDALKVTSKNGLYVLKAADYISGGTSQSALAVSAISGNTVSFTPVVSGVAAGAGIAIESLPNGTAVIGTSDLQNSLLDAYSITYNGAASQNDGLFSYLTFPKGRTSAATIALPIRGLKGDVSYSCSLWALTAGAAHTLTIRMHYVQDPGTGESTEMPDINTPAVTTTMQVDGSATSLALCETEKGMEIGKSGLAVAVISTTGTPSSDVRVLRVGFRLLPVKAANSEDDASQGIPETTKAITMSGVAGAAIRKYQAVKVSSSGKLMACRAANQADSGECVGVSLTDAEVGDDIEYMLLGIVQSTDFYSYLDFTPVPGAQIFLGADGRLTNVTPSIENGYAFSQRVGTALTEKIIQINIGTSVRL